MWSYSNRKLRTKCYSINMRDDILCRLVSLLRSPPGQGRMKYDCLVSTCPLGALTPRRDVLCPTVLYAPQRGGWTGGHSVRPVVGWRLDEVHGKLFLRQVHLELVVERVILEVMFVSHCKQWNIIMLACYLVVGILAITCTQYYT